MAIPALYFTNLISARPLLGPAGAGSLAQVVNAAHRQQGPLRRDDANSSPASAKATPPASGRTCRSDRPEFREKLTSRQIASRRRKKRKAEEMV